jgi:hypothetical protein
MRDAFPDSKLKNLDKMSSILYILYVTAYGGLTIMKGHDEKETSNQRSGRADR